MKARHADRYRDAMPRLRKLHDEVLAVLRDDSTVITVNLDPRALKQTRREP